MSGGEKTAVEKAVFDISNARRLGISANTIIEDLHRGLQAILQAERDAGAKKDPGPFGGPGSC